MNDVPNVPSKAAAVMLSELALKTEDQIELLHDLGISIASNFETATANIENPTKKRVKGCEVIHLGSHLFLPIRNLKKSLEDEEITLEDYLRKVNQITDSLCEVVDNNTKVMGNPNVRNHMKRLTNTIILGVEAGVIINTMFAIIARDGDDAYD